MYVECSYVCECGTAGMDISLREGTNGRPWSSNVNTHTHTSLLSSFLLHTPSSPAPLSPIVKHIPRSIGSLPPLNRSAALGGVDNYIHIPFFPLCAFQPPLHCTALHCQGFSGLWRGTWEVEDGRMLSTESRNNERRSRAGLQESH